MRCEMVRSNNNGEEGDRDVFPQSNERADSTEPRVANSSNYKLLINTNSNTLSSNSNNPRLVPTQFKCTPIRHMGDLTSLRNLLIDQYGASAESWTFQTTR